MHTITLPDPRVLAAAVWQDGECLAATAGTDVPRPQYSITKSLLMLTIGILCDEQRLRLHDTVGALLGTPQDAPLSRVTLEQLLTMRSGLTQKILFADRRGCPDYLEACLGTPVGMSVFRYNNADAYLAGRMAEAAAGEPLDGFITRRILTPLGITAHALEYDPQGRFFGASGLVLTLDDLAKLGQAVLDASVCSRMWLQTAMAAHTPTDDGRSYGYFLWTDGVSAYMSGKWGQKCVILPERRAVIVLNSEMPENDTSLRTAMSLTCYLED